jgi:hypothetical protein
MGGKKRVFISHSSKDTGLIEVIELACGGSEVEPYFAGKQTAGKNPADKIIEAIMESIGLFAYITPNAVNDIHTRDWINFELGAAKAKGLPIFCFIDVEVAKQESYPELMNNVTDYNHFNSSNTADCCKAAKFVRDTAFRLAGEKPPKTDVVLLNQQVGAGLIPMEEAKEIAVAYISKYKPDYGNAAVSSVTSSDGLWIIKGSMSKREQKSYGSYHWTVTIKGKDVVNYEFKPGLSWVIG